VPLNVAFKDDTVPAVLLVSLLYSLIYAKVRIVDFAGDRTRDISVIFVENCLTDWDQITISNFCWLKGL